MVGSYDEHRPHLVGSIGVRSDQVEPAKQIYTISLTEAILLSCRECKAAEVSR